MEYLFSTKSLNLSLTINLPCLYGPSPTLSSTNTSIGATTNSFIKSTRGNLAQTDFHPHTLGRTIL